MKTILLTALVALLTAQQAFTQEGNATLLAQSPDGRKVMLVWFLNNWSTDITGFDIKRKDGLQDWVKLNSEPILPGISMKKKLAVVDADKAEVNRLEARLYKLLATHKLKETQNAAYLQKLTTDDKTLRDLNDQMAHDYELALMNGFAYIDRSVTQKTNYKYGLFVAGTNRLLASAKWNYGEIPDLNTILEITSKATTKNKGIQLLWDADVNKMKGAHVAGFNIYRQGIRLNTYPVKATDSTNGMLFSWNDRSASSTEPMQYSISAESIFGIEGIIKPYTYDPAEHPEEYIEPVVTEISSPGYYMKEGIIVKWNFPKEDEKFLKGFYVEKDNMPAGYKRVSDMLGPSARAYTDKTLSPANNYIRMRVTAVYNDRTNATGAQKLYSYFPVNEPPPPQRVKATLETSTTAQGRKNIVHMTWDPPMSGDDKTDYYKVYSWQPENDLYFAVNEDRPIRGTSFNYPIPESGAGEFRFYVTAIGKSATESLAGDTVSVTIPLPVPVITQVAADSSKITVQWQYPDKHWVKGFRLYEDGNLVAGEDQLKADTHSYIISKPEKGLIYSITLQAMSESGTLSEPTNPATANVPEGK